MSLSDEEKELALKCAKEIQSHIFRGTDPDESFKMVRDNYSTKVIQVAMKMVEMSRESINNEKNDIANCINRCMAQVTRSQLDKVGKDDTTVDDFYDICIEAYHIFMNDKEGRALPICFLYIKGNENIGVVPIDTGDDNVSPMDYLKEIVYQEKPDAYCFCGEGAMNHNIEESTHKYGDIINDPTSKDIVIIQGNTKSGDKPLQKMYDITEVGDKVILEEMKDFVGENMESEKLP